MRDRWRTYPALVFVAGISLTGCAERGADDTDGQDGLGDLPGDADDDSTDGGDAGTGDPGSESADEHGDDTAEDGEAGDSNDESAGDNGDGTEDGGDDPDGPDLPPPAGACPTFADGELTFNPTGGARTVRIWLDSTAAAAMDGPVIFYWYGTGGQPSQAQSALGNGIATVTAMGGIVAAPVHANSGTYPWLGGGDSDHRLTDEVVACAEQQIGIDERRIHAFGMSAGGLFTSQLSFARSSYLASVATWSGGGTGSFQDPSNKFAAMIFHGGDDDVFVTDFKMLSEQYRDALFANGNFAFICDHGMGHTFPPGGGAPTLQFFLDHPYGTDPSPYAGGFPAGIPDYCVLP